MKTTITRKTIVGFGYCPWTPESPEPPSEPTHTGTIKTCREKIQEDRNFQSMKDTFVATAWFVKIGGKWHGVRDAKQFGWAIDELLLTYDGEHVKNAVEVEVEQPDF